MCETRKFIMAVSYRNKVCDVIIPQDEILALHKLKAFVDDNKFVLAQMVQFLFDRIENIVGKGEGAGTSILSFSPQSFQKAFSTVPSTIFNEWQRSNGPHTNL